MLTNEEIEDWFLRLNLGLSNENGWLPGCDSEDDSHHA